MKLGTIIVLALGAVIACLALTATYLVFTAGIASAQEGGVLVEVVDPSVMRWGFLSAALAAGLAAAGAGYAVAHVGSAAVGALAEKPDLMGRVLVIVGLAEGVAIYGLIIAILILNQI
ncbi:MAG: ATP synthase subunit C [Wenzhouxiangella sp.]|jgi:V/A-type H+-transporting ATPase subunit K|nr:ATP synthase subunit C [Wenzhouxiangella sp.]